MKRLFKKKNFFLKPAMILLLVDISYARIIKVVDIFKRETDVLMTSKELPLVLVSQLPQKKEEYGPEIDRVSNVETMRERTR